jgi:hypothetical protein
LLGFFFAKIACYRTPEDSFRGKGAFYGFLIVFELDKVCPSCGDSNIHPRKSIESRHGEK